MQTYKNPATPFVWPIQGGLRDDFNILVSGTPQDRFEINLQCGPKERDVVAFHFNPRFEENQVVRNSWTPGEEWGDEERDGPFPFDKGCRFDLAILVQPTMYRVSVNGQHFCNYEHRIPLSDVSYIHVSEGVDIDRVSVDLPPSPAYAAEGGMLAPVYNPPMPFKHRIGSLYYGRMIYISGIPHSDAERFNINFCADEDIAFHFDVRLDYGDDQNMLVRNSLIGDWGEEERQTSNFPFSPNMYFEMLILVEPSCFKVEVNNSHLLAFCHRYQPLDRIDTLSIEGDIRLCHIRFQ